MTDRLIFHCSNCPISVVVETGDPQEVGAVICECTHEMEYIGMEER